MWVHRTSKENHVRLLDGMLVMTEEVFGTCGIVIRPSNILLGFSRWGTLVSYKSWLGLLYLSTTQPSSITMHFSILPVLFLAAASASAQGICGNIPQVIANQVVEINTFFNRVPTPVTTNSADCTNAKFIKSGIDAYRNGQIANPGAGCAGFYAQAVLANPQFNPAYTKLGQFVAKC
ncbi:hypothetical protein BDZ94DRAFT_1248898 [Collybia nuda]|uniref:Uncharacterized protein n=1 Tax=Collybia nuda TaxID=64659 RepID=A0A9P5YEM2_9AGAR|nr:hypothetical protein BDZ94DRAFT_1248898 [Collybia nuda]